MTDELKQEIESARELARTGDYNEHPCEIGYAETIVDLADRIEQLEAEVKTALHREAETTARYDAKIDALEAEIARKDALMEKVAQAAIDASAEVITANVISYETNGVVLRPRTMQDATSQTYGNAIRALSASEIVKEMCGE